MRLRPNERSVDQPDFVQAPDFFEAEREQLSGLQFASDPVFRRLQVSIAILAPLKAIFADNSLRDIDLGSNAIDAHVGGIGGDIGGSANAAHSIYLFDYN